MGQGQTGVVRIGEAGRVGDIADLHRLTGLRGDPKARGAVLEHNGRAGLEVGDGSMNPQPPSEIADMNAGNDIVHRGLGKGPRTGGGAAENLNVSKRRDLDFGTRLLHLSVELSTGSASYLNVSDQQVLERVFIVAVHFDINVSAYPPSMSSCRRPPGIMGLVSRSAARMTP